MRNVGKNKRKLPIEHSRSFLENIVVNGPVGIMMTDYDLVIKYMNDLADTIHNINIENTTSDSINLTDYVIEPKNILSIKEQLISETENNVCITYEVLIDGEEKTIRAKVNLARDEYYCPIGGFLFICEDVTEIKKLREKTRKIEKFETLKEITVTYHHEINNVLGIIYGRAEMMLKKISPDDKNRKNVESILNSVRKLENIIRKIGEVKEIKDKNYIKSIKMLDIEND